MSTGIYDRLIERADAGELASDGELTRKVWSGTPWIIEVHLGKLEDPFYEQEDDIKNWCREHFGPEGSPIHDKPGRWYSGGAVVNGWQWFGFDTEEAMEQFKAAWPDNFEKQ